MLSIVHPIRSQAIALDESKIERHPAKLESLELALDESEGFFSATLKVEGYAWRYGNVKKWKNRETAEKEFARMLEAVAEGHYKVDLYEGGEVRVDIQY